MAEKTTAELVADAKARIENLDVDQFAAEVDAGALVVDVREPHERVEAGAIPGAINIPLGTLPAAADPSSPDHRAELDPSRRIVLHCGVGGRSALGTAKLVDLGFTDVAHLERGFRAWAAAGKPTERPSS